MDTLHQIFVNFFNILGAVIRITGLIVMTMGVQMILDGTSQWLTTLKLAV